MRIMAKQYKNLTEVLAALLDGKKVRFTKWAKQYYLEILDNKIVTETGEESIMSLSSLSGDNLWEEYTDWNWKVGDSFIYHQNDTCCMDIACKVHFANEKVIFYEANNLYGVIYNNESSRKRMKRA